MENLDSKSNSDLIIILNDLSMQHEKIKKEVEGLMDVIDDIERRYIYVSDVIKNRIGTNKQTHVKSV